MSLVINSNISSLNAQNNLTKSGNALAQATERLSSGLKINSAADNAAGFAISQQYTTQIGALGQASSNASDAINLAQTAGSALQQVTANLQAIRDLAAQAANGTYTAAERGTIDKEVQQRLSEVTRIANQTTFNGQKVLDGSLKTQSFQIGANVGQTISVNLNTNVQASNLGKISEVNTGPLSDAFVNATAGDPATTIDLSAITINGTAIGASGDTASSVQDLADAINAKGIDGVSAAIDGNGGLSVFSSGDLTIEDTGSVSGSSALAATPGTAQGIDVSATVAAGSVGGTAGGAYTDATTVNAGGSLANGDVTSVDNANALISRIDVALGTTSDFAAQLGAVQNRFQSTISTLSSQTTNLKASQSTIQDADFAAETAALSKSQVLQQAGISVLSKANAQPQQVLKLLQ